MHFIEPPIDVVERGLKVLNALANEVLKIALEVVNSLLPRIGKSVVYLRCSIGGGIAHLRHCRRNLVITKIGDATEYSSNALGYALYHLPCFVKGGHKSTYHSADVLETRNRHSYNEFYSVPQLLERQDDILHTSTDNERLIIEANKPVNHIQQPLNHCHKCFFGIDGGFLFRLLPTLLGHIENCRGHVVKLFLGVDILQQELAIFACLCRHLVQAG